MPPAMVRLLVNNELVRMWKDAVIYAEIWIPFPSFHICTAHLRTAAAQWLRCCVTNRKVAGSIPDGVIGIFH